MFSLASIKDFVAGRVLARMAPGRTKRGLLALAFAIVAFVVPLGTANPVPRSEPQAGIRIGPDHSLIIIWSGEVFPGMADYVRAAYLKYSAEDTPRVFLVLNSPGGSVSEGERVIRVLQEIKQKHRLITVVAQGSMCASMCVPIYLQGNDRLAAGASIRVFHEVTVEDENGTKTDPEITLVLFTRYYIPAGVSRDWLDSILPSMKNANLWMSGNQLVVLKTGIVTVLLDERTPRPEITA